MDVDRNPCADGHLLRANGQIFGSFQGGDLDENVPVGVPFCVITLKI